MADGISFSGGQGLLRLKLSQHQSDLQQSMERLSSGLRINSAADDPAGLLVATGLNTQSRILGQAIRNVNDAISLTSVRETALQELEQILTRQNELALQAANSSYTQMQRQALQQESDALVDEFNRIVRTTEFNDYKLLDLSTRSIGVEAGSGASGQIAMNIGDGLAQTAAAGSYSAYQYYAASGGNSLYGMPQLTDVNGDGSLDIVAGHQTSLQIFRNTGSGTFAAVQTITTPEVSQEVVAADFNGDGKTDIAATRNTTRIYLGAGDGTFTLGATYDNVVTSVALAGGDVNADGITDLVAVDFGGGALVVMRGGGDGTFTASTSYTAAGLRDVVINDFDNDGITDLVAVSETTNTLHLFRGNGDGTFMASETEALSLNPGSSSGALASGDFNRDGSLDLVVTSYDDGKAQVLLNQGDGSFTAGTLWSGISFTMGATVTDINADGYQDVLLGRFGNPPNIALGRGDGTFSTLTTTNTLDGWFMGVGDVDGDGVDDVVGLATSGVRVSIAQTRQVSTMAYLNIARQEDAPAALSTLEELRSNLSVEQSNAGAIASRLSHTVNYLAAARDNHAAAGAQILDIDVAEEIAAMVRAQILVQAGTAMLAQANQSAALVAGLLQDTR